MYLVIYQSRQSGDMEIIEQGEPHPVLAKVKDINAAGRWVRARGGGLGAIKQGRWKRYREAWIPSLALIEEQEEASRVRGPARPGQKGTTRTSATQDSQEKEV